MRTIAERNGIIAEYDYNGKHRLRKGYNVGSWASYGTPSTLFLNGETYIMFTAYWDGHFPVDKIMILSDLDYKYNVGDRVMFGRYSGEVLARTKAPGDKCPIYIVKFGHSLHVASKDASYVATRLVVSEDYLQLDRDWA